MASISKILSRFGTEVIVYPQTVTRDPRGSYLYTDGESYTKQVLFYNGYSTSISRGQYSNFNLDPNDCLTDSNIVKGSKIKYNDDTYRVVRCIVQPLNVYILKLEEWK